jgi:hypothetical protein
LGAASARLGRKPEANMKIRNLLLILAKESGSRRQLFCKKLAHVLQDVLIPDDIAIFCTVAVKKVEKSNDLELMQKVPKNAKKDLRHVCNSVLIAKHFLPESVRNFRKKIKKIA